MQISDDAGRQLATVHHEPGFAVSLLVPARRTLYLRAGDREARFRGGPGQSILFESLKFVALPTRSRDALDSSVRRGLFATAFGRGYYQGFVDGASDWVPVALHPPGAGIQTSAFKVSGNRAEDEFPFDFVFGVGIARAVSPQLSTSEAGRVGIRPSTLSGPRVSLDVTGAQADALREWKSFGSVGWQWSLRIGPLSPYLGASAGAGAILQDPEGYATRASFAGMLGPMLGLSATLGRNVRLWSEAELPLLVYRIDSGTSASLSPALWLGSALAL